MGFHNKLYQLRKQRGLSQEELANRLHVSRQTVSKWELGETTPDMEKLVAMRDFFDVSLDYLVNDEEELKKDASRPGLLEEFQEKVLTEDNKRLAVKVLKVIGIILVIILIIDIISMIIHFSLHGFPE